MNQTTSKNSDGVKNKKLKAYMVSAGEPYEYAILVFHFTAKKAKNLGFGYYEGDPEFIWMEANWMKDSPHIFRFANQELLKNNEPHVIQEPQCCNECKHWGGDLNKDGICIDCLIEISRNQMNKLSI